MKHMIAALAAAGFALAAATVGAQPIRVGELNSYKSQPAFLDPYKKGWELALEEINRGRWCAGPQDGGDFA